MLQSRTNSEHYNFVTAHAFSVTTTLDRTGNYRNPGVSSLTEFLDRNDYDATGIIKSPASITRLDDTRVFPPLAWLYDWRSRLQQQIDTHFAPETAGVLDADIARQSLQPLALLRPNAFAKAAHSTSS